MFVSVECLCACREVRRPVGHVGGGREGGWSRRNFKVGQVERIYQLKQMGKISKSRKPAHVQAPSQSARSVRNRCLHHVVHTETGMATAATTPQLHASFCGTRACRTCSGRKPTERLSHEYSVRRGGDVTTAATKGRLQLQHFC